MAVPGTTGGVKPPSVNGGGEGEHRGGGENEGGEDD